MRRFTLTLGLALAAGLALFLAPRLFAPAPSALKAAPSALLVAPVEIVEVPAQAPAVPEVPMTVRVPRAGSQIPELDAPRAPVVIEPPPVPDAVEQFWRDCPACGMG